MGINVVAKRPNGKRLCITMDDVLYQYLDLALPKKVSASDFIREGIKSGTIENIVDARAETYKKIVKPSLLSKLNDGQTDIEDFC